MRIWWNGRHGRLKICCRKACGFKSHYPHLLFKHTLYKVCFYFLLVRRTRYTLRRTTVTKISKHTFDTPTQFIRISK